MKLVEKIPEEPSVPLYNYLLDLVGEEDGKENRDSRLYGNV